MNRPSYLPLIASLFSNYFFQGIATIVISQNLLAFQSQWSASLSQVTLVVSAIGLGRLLTLNLAGWFSDRFGRKPTVFVGVLAEALFFFGMVFTPNYLAAFAVALLAGVGNAFLDTSVYPIVVEAFPSEHDNSALSVLNKAFISSGQFVLPILVRWMLQNDVDYRWIFFISSLGLCLNLLIAMRLTYPSPQKTLLTDGPVSHHAETAVVVQSRLMLEGVALMIFSFVSVSLFNIFVLWAPTFAQDILHISTENSLLYVSVYSLCSFVSVFTTAFLVKGRYISVPRLMLICLFISALAQLYLLSWPSLTSLMIASMAIGIFAAGGIWQLGLALLLEFFPHNRGLVTSFYSLSTSVSVMVTPYLTGLMAERSILIAFAYNVVLAVLGFIAMVVVYIRHQQVFKYKSAQV